MNNLTRARVARELVPAASLRHASPRKDWTKPDPLPPGAEYHVFLSYRSVNRAWVINLYDVLRTHGHSVFLDQVRLAAGDRLTRVLEQGLSGSQAGVLVWSSTTADSEWVREEYEVMIARANQGGFRFVPVRLDATALPPFAAARVFLDFSNYPEGPNGGELLRLLHAVVGKPLSDAAARFAHEQDEAARLLTAEIKAAIRNGDVESLKSQLNSGSIAVDTSPALGCLAAEGLTRLKEYDAAENMLVELETRFPKAIRPKQLRALALARRGAVGDLMKAQSIISTLYELGHRDPETLGIYARTWMDRYDASGNMLHLKQSCDLYNEAFKSAPDDYYNGVNAAAKSFVQGTDESVARGRENAARVQSLVGGIPVPGDYWKTATVAEVQLMLGNHVEAGARYADAVAMAPNEIGSHETSWKQACRLMKAMQMAEADSARIRSAFAHLADCP